MLHSSRHSVREHFQRRYKAKVVENRGAQVVRELPKLILNLVEQLADLLKALPDGRRQSTRHLVQCHVDRREQLAGFIMKGVSNTPVSASRASLSRLSEAFASPKARWVISKGAAHCAKNSPARSAASTFLRGAPDRVMIFNTACW